MIPNKPLITGICFILFCFSLVAQEKKKDKEENKSQISEEIVVDKLVKEKKTINPLSPAKAAFYSAVLPGLGQAYNKKWWKIPIIYGALGAEIYIYSQNNKEYKRYRNAYKRRLAGFEDDEFFGRVTTEGLERGQKFYRKNKEVTLLVIAGTYALNIIWANVTAHLLQYNIDEDLSLAPTFKLNEIDNTGNFGLSLNFKF